MTEENQVTTKVAEQVTTKDRKKVEAGRTLAEYNHRKREELKAQKPKSEVSQYYGIGPVLAVGVIGWSRLSPLPKQERRSQQCCTSSATFTFTS